MGWFGKKPPKPPETVTHSQTFTLKGGDTRPVRDDVVELMDTAVKRAGKSEVMHAFDPARLVNFRNGGPPVWSVGVVQVPREVAVTPAYTLFVTYGFSHALSPEDERAGKNFELTLAVPAQDPPQPWTVALLRHMCRYQLTSGADLMVGDVMPCRAPITYVPFPPQHHAMMPATDLDSLVICEDPVLRPLSTPHGTIEFRRLVGVTEAYLHEVGPLPPEQRGPFVARENPLLLTDIS